MVVRYSPDLLKALSKPSPSPPQALLKPSPSIPQAFYPPRTHFGLPKYHFCSSGEDFLAYFAYITILNSFFMTLKKNACDFERFQSLRSSNFAIPYSKFEGFGILQRIASQTLAKPPKCSQDAPKYSPRAPLGAYERPLELQVDPKKSLRGT